jgi:sterol desaturase/sphingolipid hydroxylase (fatty acid hydroxylase superfamily)
VFTRAVTALPLVVLGFGRSTFGAYLAVTTLQAIFIHANVRLRFGALRWVVNTPEFHHWHHARELTDANFGGQLPVIGLLFGTLHLPGDWPAGYGIDTELPQGYAAQLVHPFVAARDAVP